MLLTAGGAHTFLLEQLWSWDPIESGSQVVAFAGLDGHVSPLAWGLPVAWDVLVFFDRTILPLDPPEDGLASVWPSFREDWLYLLQNGY